VHRNVTISSDGKLVVVPNPGDGTVSILEHRKRRVISTVPTGDGVNNLAIFIPGLRAIPHAH
jgi:DNA-binding beta-propeller fold protein YncE